MSFSSIILETNESEKYAVFTTKEHEYSNIDEFIIVYNTEKLKEFLLGDLSIKNTDIIIGGIGAQKNELFYSKCGGAMSIGAYFSTKKGYGATLIKLLSNMYNSFITSDRKHSDSISSKKLWKKIEASGEWEMKLLNNFYLDDRGRKVYVSFDKERNITIVPKRQTDNVEDDCILPTYDESSPEKMAEYTGTPFAFKFNGDVGLKSMQKRNDDFATEVYRETLAKKLPIVRPKDIKRNLLSMAKDVWNELYVGPNG
jgi:hypothetical protein